jgi:GAF domain-containing protein
VFEETFISAPDAHTHPATKGLSEVYFKPNGIQSLLDFIRHKDFKPVGVICCENRSARRDWSEENKNTLRSIAALVSHRFRFS